MTRWIKLPHNTLQGQGALLTLRGRSLFTQKLTPLPRVMTTWQVINLSPKQQSYEHGHVHCDLQHYKLKRTIGFPKHSNKITNTTSPETMTQTPDALNYPISSFKDNSSNYTGPKKRALLTLRGRTVSTQIKITYQGSRQLHKWKLVLQRREKRHEHRHLHGDLQHILPQPQGQTGQDRDKRTTHTVQENAQQDTNTTYTDPIRTPILLTLSNYAVSSSFL